MEIIMEKYCTVNQEKVARYAKAVSHPLRAFILDRLASNRDKCCYSGDMAEELPIAHSTLSKHLKELKKSRVNELQVYPVKRLWIREGTNTGYRRANRYNMRPDYPF